jgi:tetrapyrrole methylase family protein/MazG family protein
LPTRAKIAAKPRTKSKAKRRAGSSPRIRVTPRDKLAGKWFEKLVALQARLRGPGGCPWDREQTHESLRKFLIEETYEVLDAMQTSDPGKFSSELGDLLLQIIFHSILAEETGRFTISDVIEAVHTKMVRRHPHVFGNVQAKNSAEVLKNWEQIKAEERAEAHAAEGKAPETVESVLSGIPRGLPAVLEAYQLTRRASRVGFDWENLTRILEKLDEEKAELEAVVSSGENPFAKKKPGGRPSADATGIESEVGDLLFVAVNVARFLGVDPEIALQGANRKFKKRFHFMETQAAAEGRRFADIPRARMEELWNLAKAAEDFPAASATRAGGKR